MTEVPSRPISPGTLAQQAQGMAHMPPRFEGLLERLGQHGWSVTRVLPWRPSLRCALLDASHGMIRVVAAARPSNRVPGAIPRWKRQRHWYYIGYPGQPWRSVRSTLFDAFLQTRDVALVADRAIVTPPGKDGVPLAPACRCGKQRYTERQAARVLVGAERARERGAERRQERRVYQCVGDPAWWHLTRHPVWPIPLSPAPEENQT